MLLESRTDDMDRERIRNNVIIKGANIATQNARKSIEEWVIRELEVEDSIEINRKENAQMVMTKAMHLNM